MNVVFVESPGKVKKIAAALGPGFQVVPTVGHFRDLSKHSLDVDLSTFEETYHSQEEIEENILNRAKAANTIYLATDPDREGEAISWHIEQILSEAGIAKPLHRITFQAITKDAIHDALKKPRKIDVSLVDAARARRVLDRLVGYQVSPVLWFSGIPSSSSLSAGRVQIAALNLILARDREIRGFLKKYYYVVSAVVTDPVSAITFVCNLDVDQPIEDEVHASAIVNVAGDASTIWSMSGKTETESNTNPQPPFTTSTLLEAASTKLKLASKKTMAIAQKLYEAGLITYMRTDSVWVDPGAVSRARKVIESEYGKDYLPQSPNNYKNKDGNAQEGHEAIRPSYPEKMPDTVENESSLSADELALYTLIWQKFIASQMSPARTKKITVNVTAKTAVEDYPFISTCSEQVFAGFRAIYQDSDDEPEKDFVDLKGLSGSGLLNLVRTELNRRQTKPAPHFTEASLINALQKSGVGRPSTYAQTIEVLFLRNYVELQNRKIMVTKLGESVSDFLSTSFGELFAVEFTAGMESMLDDIAAGSLNRTTYLTEFYQNELAPRLEKANSAAEQSYGLDDDCPQCGSRLMIRKVPGERGEPADLVCCSAFPACNFVRYEVVGDCPIADCDGHLVRAYGKYGMYYRCDLGCGYVTQEVIPTNKRCPDCQSALVMKKAKTGQTFITCSKDSCTYVEREYKGRCPKCGKDMFLFFTRQGSEFIACSDRECGYVDHEKTGDDCPKCGGDLVFREGKKGKFISCSNYPDCEFKHSFKLKMVFASYRCPKCGDLLFRFRSPGTQVEMIFCGNRDRCDYKHHSIPLDQVLGICPDCGGQLYKKKGKTGNFIGCENYPSCTHISPYIPDKAPACPKCGLGMTKRRSKKGVSFWSCSNFPKCDGVEFENEPQGECPKCDGVLLKRKGPNGQFLGCSNYPACDYVRDMKMLDEMCPDCGKPLMKRKGSNGTFTACSGYPDCKYVLQKTEGSDLLDRSCPQCNSPLVLKERQSTGEKFVSCSGYPHCKHAEPADPLEIYPKGSVKKELFLICKDDSTIRLVVFVALSGILRVLVEADGFKYDIVNVNGISKGNVSRVEGRTFSLKLILHGVLLSKNLKKNNKMFAGWVVGFVGTQVETGVGGYIEMNIEISNRLNKRFSADVSDFKGNGEYEPGVVIGGKFIG